MNSIWNALQGVEFQQTYINAGGIRTRSITAGSGPVLIFLHGTGGHAEAYLRNIEAHAEHFTVHAIDMVGHGYSDMPDLEYGYQDYVDHLLAFVDAIGADRVHISGESLGAQVAALFALQHPTRVNKIVMNTGILMPPDPEGRKDLEDLLERSRKATGSPDRDAIRARLRWLVHHEHHVSEELITARKTIYDQPGRAAVIRKIAEMSISSLLDDELAEKWNNPRLMTEIPCPTLLLWTRYNPGQLVPLAEEGLKLLQNGELIVLEDSAHWPQYEEPEEFNRVHIEYLLK